MKHIHYLILSLSTSLLGVSILLMGHHRHIELTTNFFGASDWLPASVFNGAAGGAFILIAALAVVAWRTGKYTKLLGVALVVVSALPLLSLLSDAMWIEKLGGFPAIGSGQGVIKYFALLAIGLMWLLPNLNSLGQKIVAVFPPVLVLLWIGGMKFTELEAQGIEALVASSPLMGWMYSVWDLQTTSNIIGVYDLLAVGLLIGSVFYRQLLLPAVLMAGAVFAVTQTFLFTWEGALSAETLLSTGGHFLIKDLWYLSNLAWLYSLVHQPQDA